MIGYYPSLYPDELIYGYLSRLVAHNGYMVNRHASSDIYGRNIVFPSIEFIDKLTPELQNHLVKDGSYEELVLNHTMIPFYSEFLPKERKQTVRQAVLSGTGRLTDLLPTPTTGKGRYLRYCPICTENDRKTFGEAYWHRLHQIHGINVCTEHGCKLVNSAIAITNRTDTGFLTAEATVADSCFSESADESEIRLAEYIKEVIGMSRLEYSGNLAEFLNRRLLDTEYSCKRGSVRKIKKLSEDTGISYTHLTTNLKSGRFDFMEICKLARHIGITAEELVHRNDTKEDYRTERIRHFDNEVKELLKQGISGRELARRYNVSSRQITCIRDNLLYQSKRSIRGKGGIQKINRSKQDELLLVQVKDILKQILEDTESRPVRITPSYIAGKLNLRNDYFRKYPKCLEEIRKYQVSYEEYWAKEMEWAVRQLETSQGEINYTQIDRLINVKKENMIKALPYVKDERLQKILKAV